HHREVQTWPEPQPRRPGRRAGSPQGRRGRRCVRNGPADARYAGLMAVRIVRLGSARAANEGLRIGTVRRPPRGVPKSRFASQNWYDVWFPNLAPSVATMKLALAAESEKEWGTFVRKYRAEMKA